MSCRVKLLRPLKMMGSTLHFVSGSYRGHSCWVYARYAMTIESWRSMASSATALVRSTVRRTEFICRRRGSNGASSITEAYQYLSLFYTTVHNVQPVLSKLLSANASGYLQPHISIHIFPSVDR